MLVEVKLKNGEIEKVETDVTHLKIVNGDKLLIVNRDNVFKLENIESFKISEIRRDVVYVAKAEYPDKKIAEMSQAKLISNTLELEKFVLQEGNTLLVRNSTREKAEEITEMFRQHTNPIDIQIVEESLRPRSKVEGARKALKIVGEVGDRLARIPSQRAGEERQRK